MMTSDLLDQVLKIFVFEVHVFLQARSVFLSIGSIVTYVSAGVRCPRRGNKKSLPPADDQKTSRLLCDGTCGESASFRCTPRE